MLAAADICSLGRGEGFDAARVLIVDDDDAFREVLSAMVAKLGGRATAAATLAQGLAAAAAGEFHVVLLDVVLPDGNGLEALPSFNQLPGRPEVIIITGAGLPDSAGLAFKSGAWDFLEKPADFDSLALTLSRAVKFHAEKSSVRSALVLKREELVGDSAALWACLEQVGQAALSPVNVLITGETGVGKELVARAIHANSAQAGASFVVIDCAALPETLVESILFGHARGAFTGAERASQGLIKQAERGTLFLDEVGELPLPVQKSFLRVLQEKAFRPVGGQAEERVEFRLIAATNRDLEELADQGLFRRDLLHRLRHHVLEVPPLRQRGEDIPALVTHWLAKLSSRFGLPLQAVSPEFLAVATAYPWPGNVRELINALESAMLASFGAPTLYPRHLPARLRTMAAQARPGGAGGQGTAAPAGGDVLGQTAPEPPQRLREVREQAANTAERRYLEELLAATQGNVAQACGLAGLSPPRLYALLKKHHIVRTKTS